MKRTKSSETRICHCGGLEAFQQQDLNLVENINGHVQIIEHTSIKDSPVAIEKFCNFFLNQNIYRDEPCSHANTKCISKQKRSCDEMETVILTCLSCGRVQNK